jgi:hypothetical protein
MDTMSDERDKLIELKSIRIAHWIFTGGFLSGDDHSGIGMEPWAMFVSLITSGFLGPQSFQEVLKFIFTEEVFNYGKKNQSSKI